MDKNCIADILKRKKPMVLIVTGLVAAAVLIAAGSAKKTAAPAHTDADSIMSYARELESKTAELIESLDGVSKASVAVILEGGKEKVYAEDGDVSGAGKSNRYVTSGGEPLLLKELAPRVSGVAVVCRASGSASAEAEIIRLISALYGLPANHIYVST